MKFINFTKKYILKHKKGCFIYLFLSLLSCLMTISIPFFTGQLIDVFVDLHDLSTLFFFIKIIICLFLVSLISSYCKSILYDYLYSKTVNEMCLDILSYIRKLPLSYFRENNSVYLIERITQDSNELISFINEYLNLFIQIITLCIGIIIMLLLNLKIALLLVLLFPFYILTYVIFKQKLYELKKRYIEKDNAFISSLNQQICKISFIKLNGLYDFMHSKISFIFNDFFSYIIRFTKVLYLYLNTSDFFTKTATIILYLYGGIEIYKKNLSIGQFSIINLYFGLTFTSIQYFITYGEKYQSALVSYNRLTETFQNPLEINGDIKLDTISRIKLDNVSFSYHKEKKVLNNFNYEFNRANLYLIQGCNGSGKSTLVKVLLGIEQGYQGSITYNDIELKKLDSYLMKKLLIGITEQEPFLLNDTLRNNLLLDNTCIIDSKILELCKKLNLENLITKLPFGLDTVIDENNSVISGGEKQKLSIIRTLLKNPDVIILDEPSSAMDENSISKLKELLLQLKSTKIIIMISHDDKLLSVADKIVTIN